MAQMNQEGGELGKLKKFDLFDKTTRKQILDKMKCDQ